jgi:hypothetical protein
VTVLPFVGDALALIATAAPDVNELFDAGEVIETLSAAIAFGTNSARPAKNKPAARKRFLTAWIAFIERSSGESRVSEAGPQDKAGRNDGGFGAAARSSAERRRPERRRGMSRAANARGKRSGDELHRGSLFRAPLSWRALLRAHRVLHLGGNIHEH